jgi:heat shock protein HtpX
MLDASRRRAHKARNVRQSLLLVGGLTIVTAFSAWLLWSWPGVIVTMVWVLGLYLFAPRVPPEMVMRMYRATRLDPRGGDQITPIVAALSRRAELPAVPEVYIIPSATLNAFATGRPEKAVIGITEACCAGSPPTSSPACWRMRSATCATTIWR